MDRRMKKVLLFLILVGVLLLQQIGGNRVIYAESSPRVD